MTQRNLRTGSINNLGTVNLTTGQALMTEFLRIILPGRMLINERPDWLHGMEIDLFYPDYSLAFEFQGEQHFVPVYGYEALTKQRERDKLKKKLLRKNGITLIEVVAANLTVNSLWQKVMSRAKWLSKTRLIPIKEAWERCKPLGPVCVQYRKTLREKYDSPTARYGEQKNKAMQRWHSDCPRTH